MIVVHPGTCEFMITSMPDPLQVEVNSPFLPEIGTLVKIDGVLYRVIEVQGHILHLAPHPHQSRAERRHQKPNVIPKPFYQRGRF